MMWRRVWFALLSYVFATTVLSFVFNAMAQGVSDIETAYQLPVTQLVIFTIAFVLFIAILCGWYMGIRNVRYGRREGIRFGLTLMATTLLLDVSALMIYDVSYNGAVLSIRYLMLFLRQPLVIIRLVVLVSVPILCGLCYQYIKQVWYTTYMRRSRHR